MMIVFAFGMSSPDSMIVVQTRTSASPEANVIITFSSEPSGIWPWPTTNRAPGSSRRSCSVWASIVSTRLWTKKTCPPRSSSRRIASRTSPAEASATRVWIGSRSSGGVSITDMSRTPARARLRVRGIGVAESVRTSTSRRSCFKPLLGRDPEPLLLVDDDEAEVAELDVLRQEPVRPDHEIDRPVLEPGDRPFLLGRRDEPRQEADTDRERREALRERLVMLGGEDRRRDEDGDLRARPGSP